MSCQRYPAVTFDKTAGQLIRETPECAWFSWPRRSGSGGQSIFGGTMWPKPCFDDPEREQQNE
jgi:hypothetical protein